MKEFYFLINNESQPQNIQAIDDFNYIAENIADAIKTQAKISIKVLSDESEIAKTSFLKIVKSKGKYFVNMDSFIPYRANSQFKSVKKGLLSYSIDFATIAFPVQLYTILEPHKTFVINFPEKIYRLYARNHYRYTLSQFDDIFIHLNMNKTEFKLPLNAISEGGFSFFSSNEYDFYVNELNEKGIFLAKIVMGYETIIPVTIQIKNQVPSKNRKFRYVIGTQIVNIDNSHQEFIAKFVFKKQMEELQRINLKKN